MLSMGRITSHSETLELDKVLGSCGTTMGFSFWNYDQVTLLEMHPDPDIFFVLDVVVDASIEDKEDLFDIFLDRFVQIVELGIEILDVFIKDQDISSHLVSLVTDSRDSLLCGISVFQIDLEQVYIMYFKVLDFIELLVLKIYLVKCVTHECSEPEYDKKMISILIGNVRRIKFIIQRIQVQLCNKNCV